MNPSLVAPSFTYKLLNIVNRYELWWLLFPTMRACWLSQKSVRSLHVEILDSSYSYGFCGGWISLCSVSPSNSLFFLLSVSYGDFSLTMVSQSNILYPRRPLTQQHCGPGWLDWYFHILWKLNNGCSVVGVYWWENVSGFFKNLSSHTNFPLAYPSVASFYMQQTVFSAILM